MAEQLKQLEKDMGEAARSLAGAQNPVSNKLRNALSEAEQNELELNMRRNAEFIRRGYGMSAWVRENTVTKGLNDLRDRLQQAQAAMQDPNQNGKGPGGDKGDIERALAQVEAMRNRMQQLAQSQGRRGNGRQQGYQQDGQLQRGQDQGQPGQSGQPGQQGQQGQQGGQQGQQGGQQGQQGGQPGQGGQQGQQGQQGGQQGGPGGQYGPGGLGNTWQGGVWGPRGGPGPVYPHNGYIADGPIPVDQGYRESLRDLGQLRDFLREHPEFNGDVQQLMRSLNPVYQNEAELVQRISREILPSMERLELELRRKLDDKNGDQVRSAGTETIPPGYAGAVADYFRKLSKGK